MRCVIVDDEPLAREEMQELIKEVSQMEVVGVFSNALTTMEFLKEHQADLIFLDIEMPMVTGLEFAAQLPKQILTIFTTAYSQYAFKSYELDAIDYLLKPIDKARLEKAISKAEAYKRLLSDDTEKNIVQSNTSDFLIIKSDRRFHRLNFNDIRYIEGLKDYVVIYTGSQKLITAMNLKTIHQKMPQHLFIRVSKSYVVNIDYVDSFDHHNVYVGESEIPIGEVYKKDFFKMYSGGSLNPEE
ncbi:LytR/AlgR family response regulator transcription factor [Chitinophaga ginsengisoli]|uniref:LytTR family two component transcriptional regulator n=1 Tax=Chitinophaga ginsengisoli TaxID=363837 RepID=A0A2P8G0Q9_9BACT|nr:LytTR family DNA-binding domain-containing protein [Chitinophaga ginsengisoli]PSL27558.1 LytTR family two component transcriptional regulator [Chitinophaga ginsengisoli]